MTSMTKNNFVEWGAGFLFFLATILFFGLAYPHHLHFQEQYQLFLFDSSYVWDVVRLPGGVADLLGRFCTQFFLFAWVGAFIIAFLLTAIQLMTLRLTKCCGIFFGLSFVPSCLLWLFMLDENALLGGVWAVLLTLIASWLFSKLSPGWVRRILLVAAVPVLYWMVGPVSILFFLLNAPRLTLSAKYYGVFALFVVMILVLAHFLPVPAGSLWRGIHYHRYPTEFSAFLWAAIASLFLLSLLFKIKPLSIGNVTWGKVLSFALVAICMVCFIWKNANFKAEKVMRYDFMARYQQWNRILETISKEHPNNQIGVTVQNLALGMTGMLVDHMTEYNQNGLLGLLPEVQRDATSPLPTAEALYQLGLIYVAQRTFFEAQEAILDFQKSARCYKRLAETNLIIGSYEVSRKYLTALQKTLFYSKWADETMKLLGDEKAIENHLEYGRLRKTAIKDFYFGDGVTPDMLKDLYLSNKDNRIAYQYMLAAYVLTGDRDSFYKFYNKK